ncbi:MAG TPA: GNAT family N-acetyltransferase [Candidatus Dormibacteraeota bacterium]|nr:GNAT family N-acetyltransferase [Candidatus Dormibacteraeota bacterium]
MSLSIKPESFSSEDARHLVSALDGELSQSYLPEQRFGPNLKAEQLDDGRGLFLIARDGADAVGCGAIRLLDPATAEAKRMYVKPGHRGKGVGRAVLDRLEAEARRLGVNRIVLETGIYQDAAIALYRRAGYEQVDCWGEYVTSATSVCFAKDLQ